MHDEQMVRRFIDARAQGRPFARIALELGVSKQTLITWSRKHRFDIQNLRAVQLEALRDDLLKDVVTRATSDARRLTQVEAELSKRNLADLTTPQLLRLSSSLRDRILRETDATRMIFTTPVSEVPDNETVHEVQDWRP